MAMIFRFTGFSFFLCVLVAAASVWAAGSNSGPTSKEDALKSLDAILVRIRADALKGSDDTCVDGVSRDETDATTGACKVSVSPYTHIGCGCCGNGDVQSTLCDNDLKCIAAVGGITSLTIHRSQITDNGLQHLAKLSGLQEVDLSENAISDKGLQHLAKLSSLRILKLRKTQIAGSGLVHLTTLRDLHTLDIENTPVTGEAMACLEQLPLLERLFLSKTRIDDNGLTQFAGLKQLRILSLGTTKVSDAGLAHLSSLTDLRELSLDGTQVKGDGLLHLGNLKQIQWLYCQPMWSKDLAAVLAQWKKLGRSTIQIPDPNVMPASERQIELYGMESLSCLSIICPHGAEAIDLRDMRKLQDVSVSPSPWSGGHKKPNPRIGQFRISGLQSLRDLHILMPDELILPDLKTIDSLRLDGVLKTEKLDALRNMELREIGLHASPDSQPSVLSIFAGTIRNQERRDSTLWLTVDGLNAAWLEQLGRLIPSPADIRITTRTFNSNGMIDLAKLDGLTQLSISATDPVAMPQLLIVGPASLRSLTLTGFHTDEVHCKGWCPNTLNVPSARRVVVSDLGGVKRISLPLNDRDKISEFEVHNAPDLEVICHEPTCTTPLCTLVVHNAPKLHWMRVANSRKLTSFRLIGSFPDLRSVDVRCTGISDLFLAQLVPITTLNHLETEGCGNLSAGAIREFQQMRPDVDGDNGLNHRMLRSRLRNSPDESLVPIPKTEQ